LIVLSVFHTCDPLPPLDIMLREVGWVVALQHTRSSRLLSSADATPLHHVFFKRTSLIDLSSSPRKDQCYFISIAIPLARLPEIPSFAVGKFYYLSPFTPTFCPFILHRFKLLLLFFSTIFSWFTALSDQSQSFQPIRNVDQRMPIFFPSSSTPAPSPSVQGVNKVDLNLIYSCPVFFFQLHFPFSLPHAPALAPIQFFILPVHSLFFSKPSVF